MTTSRWVWYFSSLGTWIWVQQVTDVNVAVIVAGMLITIGLMLIMTKAGA